MMSFVQKIFIDRSDCHKFAMTQNMRKRCCNSTVTFHMIGLLPTNHIIDYITWHTRVYEDTSVANSEIAQTTQNIT